MLSVALSAYTTVEEEAVLLSKRGNLEEMKKESQYI
jgi:hypothetical protein